MVTGTASFTFASAYGSRKSARLESYSEAGPGAGALLRATLQLHRSTEVVASGSRFYHWSTKRQVGVLEEFGATFLESL